MIYLVYGQDSYRAKEKLEQVAQDFPRRRLVGKEELSQDNWQSQLADQQSLFGEKTLLVFDNVLDLSISQRLGELCDWLQSCDSSQKIAFRQSGDVDKRLKITKWLLNQAQVFEFKPLRVNELRAWINEHLGKNEIEKEAVGKLIEFHGHNLWYLKNELNKLTQFTGGREITLENVLSLSSRTAEENIFDFVDALSYQNKTKAARLLDNLISEGQEVGYLFAMMVRQFRLLLLAKTNDGLKGQHPFVVGKVKQQSPRWKKRTLENIYRKLLEIDLGSKTGEKDLETELWLLVAGL